MPDSGTNNNIIANLVMIVPSNIVSVYMEFLHENCWTLIQDTYGFNPVSKMLHEKVFP